MKPRCLACHAPLEGTGDYHPACAKRLFGMFPAPRLEVSLRDLKALAAREVLARITVTGVQKKLSLGVEGRGMEARFTIIGLWGAYILKPPAVEYPNLPENENIIMRLAEACGIPVVPQALIRLASGELAFICRRIDRTKRGEKLAMEDFCQISERQTEDKSKGSLERVGKLLSRFSIYPGLDAVDLLERALFCHLVGNSNMHLKNYSLIESGAGLRLAPAYDLLSTALAIPEDTEESALTINGKKNKLGKIDFDRFASSLGISPVAAANVYRKFHDKRAAIGVLIQGSFLPRQAQTELLRIINLRYSAITAGRGSGSVAEVTTFKQP